MPFGLCFVIGIEIETEIAIRTSDDTFESDFDCNADSDPDA